MSKSRPGGKPAPSRKSPPKKSSAKQSSRPTRSKPGHVSASPAKSSNAKSSNAKTGAKAGDANGERLQKILAAAGLGSRRKCEEFIVEGRVEVDGKQITELGTRVDPDQAEIRVDGELLRRPRMQYFLLNKPPNVVCTNYDPQQRPRVVDLVPSSERLYPIGRLDRASEGLILLTNDGEFANLMAHPRYGVPKTYRVCVDGHPTAEQLQTLRSGVRIAEGLVKALSVATKKKSRNTTELQIVLREGKNREIRRMLAKVGHKVLWLRRVAIGDLKLDKDFPLGAYRPLTSREVEELRRSTRQSGKKASRRKRPTRKKAAVTTSKAPPIPQTPRRQGSVLK